MQTPTSVNTPSSLPFYLSSLTLLVNMAHQLELQRVLRVPLVTTLLPLELLCARSVPLGKRKNTTLNICIISSYLCFFLKVFERDIEYVCFLNLFFL